MPSTWLIFTVAGPAFLLLALVRCLLAHRLVPQARVWFIVGGVFCLVALWLRLNHS